MEDSTTRVLLVALYSSIHPAVGESLGIAVLGGCIENAFSRENVDVNLLDLYATDKNRETQLLDTISKYKPQIIGFSVTYGTFTFLENIYPKLKHIWNQNRGLIVFGGPIPTFAPEQFVPGLDPSALVVTGEGDESIVLIIKHFRERLSYSSIPNIYQWIEKKIIRGPRKLANLNDVPLPKRDLVPATLRLGGQIFIETSRGCSWGKCTLCRRGLTDIKGNGEEYRRYPINHVIQDLVNIYNLGVRSVTFADEEFISHLDNSMLEWLNTFRLELEKNDIIFNFDISAMVRSVVLDSWNSDQAKERVEIWNILQEIGLRKVFLGIESGSVTQLKRFCKNATPLQNSEAIRILRLRGIEIECGFIMFDPLCNINEIRENVNFIQTHNLTGYISSLSNELRIDKDGTYFRLLVSYEKKHGVELFRRPYDRSTLTFQPLYIDPKVNLIVEEVRKWRKVYGRIHYLAKAMTRYGKHGSIGEQYIDVIKGFLSELREIYFARFSLLVDSESLDNDKILRIRSEFYNDINNFAKESIKIISILKDTNVIPGNLLNELNTTALEIISQSV